MVINIWKSQNRSGTKHTALWCTRDICVFFKTAKIRLQSVLEAFGKYVFNINPTTKAVKSTNMQMKSKEMF